MSPGYISETHCTACLHLHSSPPVTILPVLADQSQHRISPSPPRHWMGLLLGARGLMVRLRPELKRTAWVVSDDSGRQPLLLPHLAVRGPGHAVHWAGVGGQGRPQHPGLGPDLNGAVLAPGHDAGPVPAPSERTQNMILSVNLYTQNTEHDSGCHLALRHAPR